MTRLETKFSTLKAAGKKAFVTFISAGDPDLATSQAILNGLPAAGADIIELGMPFSDPMAEGPPIQKSSFRALQAGQNMHKTLDMVRAFRKTNSDTPIILMGYYNPIYIYGVPKFIADAKAAGVDGLIVVDLPPEMDDELCIPATKAGLHFIRLVTPTCGPERLKLILNHASGFLYYVSITGITGTQTPDFGKVATALTPIRAATDLPIAVGFGVKTPENAATVASFADAVVVGSSLVTTIEHSLDSEGRATPDTINAVHSQVSALKKGMS